MGIQLGFLRARMRIECMSGANYKTLLRESKMKKIQGKKKKDMR